MYVYMYGFLTGQAEYTVALHYTARTYVQYAPDLSLETDVDAMLCYAWTRLAWLAILSWAMK